MAQQIDNPPAMQETQKTRVQSLSREDLLEKEMATTVVLLPEKSHGQRAWRATVHRLPSQTQLSV